MWQKFTPCKVARPQRRAFAWGIVSKLSSSDKPLQVVSYANTEAERVEGRSITGVGNRSPC